MPIVLFQSKYFVVDPNFLSELNVAFDFKGVKLNAFENGGEYFLPDPWKNNEPLRRQ